MAAYACKELANYKNVIFPVKIPHFRGVNKKEATKNPRADSIRRRRFISLLAQVPACFQIVPNLLSIEDRWY